MGACATKHDDGNSEPRATKMSERQARGPHDASRPPSPMRISIARPDLSPTVVSLQLSSSVDPIEMSGHESPPPSSATLSAATAATAATAAPTSSGPSTSASVSRSPSRERFASHDELDLGVVFSELPHSSHRTLFQSSLAPVGRSSSPEFYRSPLHTRMRYAAPEHEAVLFTPQRMLVFTRPWSHRLDERISTGGSASASSAAALPPRSPKIPRRRSFLTPDVKRSPSLNSRSLNPAAHTIVRHRCTGDSGLKSSGGEVHPCLDATHCAGALGLLSSSRRASRTAESFSHFLLDTPPPPPPCCCRTMVRLVSRAHSHSGPAGTDSLKSSPEPSIDRSPLSASVTSRTVRSASVSNANHTMLMT